MQKYSTEVMFRCLGTHRLPTNWRCKSNAESLKTVWNKARRKCVMFSTIIFDCSCKKTVEQKLVTEIFFGFNLGLPEKTEKCWGPPLSWHFQGMKLWCGSLAILKLQVDKGVGISAKENLMEVMFWIFNTLLVQTNILIFVIFIMMFK